MKKRFFSPGIIILFTVISFASCSQASGSNEVTSVTPNEYAILSYDTNYSTSGTVPKPGIVKVGDTITVAANTGTLAKTGWTFGGWSKNPDGSGTVYTPGMTVAMPSGSLTFYAIWQSYAYSIIFDCQTATTQAGYLEKTIKSPMTTPETLPTPPSKTGFAFGGWWTEANGGGTELTATTKVTSSMTVYAYWPTYYTIAFDSQDATVAATPAAKNVALTDTTIGSLPPAPSKTGYTFGGWWTQPNGGGTEFTAATAVTSRMTVYAKWNPIFYSVTYVLNGGTNSALNPATYTIKTTEITFADATRAGCSFTGWYTDNSFTTKITGIPPQTTGAVTLYAKWTLELYSITYVLNGGTNSALNPANYTIKTTEITFADPTRSGCSFAGWYTDNSFMTKITGIPPQTTGAATLYAKWTIDFFPITYVLNGGTNHSFNPSSYSTETASFLLGDPTRSGYDFNGWYLDSGFTTKVPGIITGSIGSMTFYAKWTLTNYSIVYALNGGENAAVNPAGYTIENTIIFSDATRADYIFKGWYSDSNCKSKVTGISSGSIGNMTVYAKWVHVPYSITYMVNGGTNSALNPSSYSEDNEALTYTAPNRTGYDFAGWFSDIGLTSKVTGIPAGSNGNMTVYAKWIITSYSINYVLNGGINGASNPPNYTIESSSISFRDPSATGYTFAGWYSDGSFANKISGVPSGSSGNLTVFAKWFPINGIYVTVSIPGDGTVTFSNNSLIVAKGSPFSISIVQMSYANYAWYLDLDQISGASGSSVSIATGSLSAGVHELMIVLTDSKGKSSSATCRFSVTN